MGGGGCRFVGDNGMSVPLLTVLKHASSGLGLAEKRTRSQVLSDLGAMAYKHNASQHRYISGIQVGGGKKNARH